MILDSLIFALGFLVAGLLALAALPAVWRRAMRLSGERLARLVPLSPQEIAAERDHLRAAHAVALRRTEQRLERADAERATLMAEASRREDRLAALTAELARAEAAIAALSAEAARRGRDLAAAAAEVGTALVALHDATGLADRRWAEVVDLTRDNQRLSDQVDRDRAALAALETRLLGATTRADDLARDLTLARETPPAPPDLPRPPAAEPDPSLATAAERAARALEHRRTIEHLNHEIAFAHEQASSAERRATEASRESARITAERDALAAELAMFKAVPEAPPEDDRERPRAAIDRISDGT